MNLEHNELLYKIAFDAILRLFGDRSLSKEVARNNLEGIRYEIDILIKSLEE